MVYREAQDSCARCGRLLDRDQSEVLESGLHCWACSRQQEIDVHLADAGLLPRERIGDRQEAGPATLLGVAGPGEIMLQAPLSARVCLAYFFQIDDLLETASPLLAQGTAVADLWIDDGTGRIRVDGERSALGGPLDWERKTGLLEAPLLPGMETVLAAAGIRAMTALGTARELRFTEAILRAGDTVRVVGEVTIAEERSIRGTLFQL